MTSHPLWKIMTDQPTDRRTDRLTHGEVSIQINIIKDLNISFTYLPYPPFAFVLLFSLKQNKSVWTEREGETGKRGEGGRVGEGERRKEEGEGRGERRL